VQGSEHSTYAAEQNLEPDPILEPIRHPMVDQFFRHFENGAYVRIDPDGTVKS
jgi:hemimethylated DNA binding protein